MKFILLSLLIAFGGFSTQRICFNEVSSSNFTSQTEQQSKRCLGINRKNKQCGNSANPGSDYCIWHEPNRLRCKAIAKSTGKNCNNTPEQGSEYCSAHKR